MRPQVRFLETRRKAETTTKAQRKTSPIAPPPPDPLELVGLPLLDDELLLELEDDELLEEELLELLLEDELLEELEMAES